MLSTKRTQRRYDHRLRELVQTTGDIKLATERGVPASTARGWLTKSAIEVVSIDVLDLDTTDACLADECGYQERVGSKN